MIKNIFFCLTRVSKYLIYHFSVKIIEGSKLTYLTSVFKNLFVFLFTRNFDYKFPSDMIIQNRYGRFKIKKNTCIAFNIESFLQDMLFDVFNDKGENKKLSTFIDIGANIGFYSIVQSHFKNKIYAVEAISSTYNILTENIKLNNLDKVITPINLGISNANKKVKFYSCLEQNGMSSVHPLPSQNGYTINEKLLNCITMDDLFKKYKIDIKKIGFIKIDIEGHEYPLFKGFKSLSSLTKGCKLLVEIMNDDTKEKALNLIQKQFELKRVIYNNYLFIKN